MVAAPKPTDLAPGERATILVVALAQFVNVLEFVIVMPLGPDFAAALRIPPHQLPYVASSYTGAAALAGLVGAFVLDRFDRRRALRACLAGLVVATAAGGLMRSFPALVAARAMAGLFGGPATSISMSIVADAVPPERRGRAFSLVLLATSIALVLGMPLGLELAALATWRAPLFAIAGIGVVAVVTTARLPPFEAHVAEAAADGAVRTIARLLRNPIVLASYAMTFVLQMSGFLLIPSTSPYLQLNLGFPREALGLLYLAGGSLSALATKRAGRWVDRLGSLPIALVGLVLLSSAMAVAVLDDRHVAPLPFVFAGYMVFALALALRNVAYNTLASKVPRPAERARFQSLQSTVTHVAISVGAAVAAHLLHTGPRDELVGMPRVAHLAIGISALVPFFMWRVERGVRVPS